MAAQRKAPVAKAAPPRKMPAPPIPPPEEVDEQAGEQASHDDTAGRPGALDPQDDRDPSLPPPWEDTPTRKADPHSAMMREKWKDQQRVPCTYPGCFYPLNVFKGKDALTVPVQTDDGEALKAVCSWNPEHMDADGLPQFILLSELKPKVP